LLSGGEPELSLGWASIVAFPAWVVATNAIPFPRSVAPTLPMEEYEERARQRWREYQPQNSVRAMWVMAAMVFGGGVAVMSESATPET